MWCALCSLPTCDHIYPGWFRQDVKSAGSVGVRLSNYSVFSQRNSQWINHFITVICDEVILFLWLERRDVNAWKTLLIGTLEDINHQLCFWPLWGNDWCKFVANYDEWNCYISNPGLTTSLQHSQGWDVSWALRVSVLWYKYRLWWCHAAWPLHRHRSGVNSPLGLSCFAQVKWRT